jgi:hypothetical protein
MAPPHQPATLSAEQVAELHRQLSTMRHDINNQMSIIVAALELVRMNPDMAEKMYDAIAQQPKKVGDSMTKFSSAFEQTLGITRP